MRPFPFAVLADELDLVGEEGADGKIIEDAEPHRSQYRAMLPDFVVRLHEYWAAWRREHTSPPVRRPPKVGRNEPCPCGSGRKYKKCCG
jgi:uncharacterized protein YecA (UPF0149 family)